MTKHTTNGSRVILLHMFCIFSLKVSFGFGRDGLVTIVASSVVSDAIFYAGKMGGKTLPHKMKLE